MRANFDLLGSENAESSESLADGQRQQRNGNIHYYIPNKYGCFSIPLLGSENAESSESLADGQRQQRNGNIHYYIPNKYGCFSIPLLGSENAESSESLADGQRQQRNGNIHYYIPNKYGCFSIPLLGSENAESSESLADGQRQQRNGNIHYYIPNKYGCFSIPLLGSENAESSESLADGQRQQRNGNIHYYIPNKYGCFSIPLLGSENAESSESLADGQRQQRNGNIHYYIPNKYGCFSIPLLGSENAESSESLADGQRQQRNGNIHYYIPNKYGCFSIPLLGSENAESSESLADGQRQQRNGNIHYYIPNKYGCFSIPLLGSENAESSESLADGQRQQRNGNIHYYIPNKYGCFSIPLLGSENAESSESLADGQRQQRNGNIHYYIPNKYEESRAVFLRQMSKTISHTHGLKGIRRSRLIHAFYVIALPAYTIFGALIFKALDGDYDDVALAEYEVRCVEHRERSLNLSNPDCLSSPPCLTQLRISIKALDDCFRARSYIPHPTYSMSSFANSLIFATSVYTTIGYGNIAPDTLSCRLATCLYAVVGIPLFFAFLKDMGQLFSQFFIKGWRLAGRLRVGLARRLRRRRPASALKTLVEQSVLPAHITMNIKKVPMDSSAVSKVREQRKVFVWAVIFFVIYLVACSYIFTLMEPDWTLWISFYFLFTSVALVGFGDVFPSEPNIVLINFAFIVLGIVLFGMCYFILQEEIREKAFQASRRVRNSIFRRVPSQRSRRSERRRRPRKRSASLDATPARLRSLLRLPILPSKRSASSEPTNSRNRSSASSPGQRSPGVAVEEGGSPSSAPPLSLHPDASSSSPSPVPPPLPIVHLSTASPLSTVV